MGEAIITRKGGGKAEGLNVWKKSRPEQAIATISLRQVNYSPLTFQLTSNDLSPQTLTADDLVGLNGTYTYADTIPHSFSIISNTEIILSSLNGGKPFTYTWDAGYGYIKLSTTMSASYSIIFKSNSGINYTKYIPVGFVVNDDPSAYPNGAIHTDGYYYELLGQVSSANVMSLSNNALATVQQDYRDTIETEVSNANS